MYTNMFVPESSCFKISNWRTAGNVILHTVSSRHIRQIGGKHPLVFNCCKNIISWELGKREKSLWFEIPPNEKDGKPLRPMWRKRVNISVKIEYTILVTTSYAISLTNRTHEAHQSISNISSLFNRGQATENFIIIFSLLVIKTNSGFSRGTWYSPLEPN